MCTGLTRDTQEGLTYILVTYMLQSRKSQSRSASDGFGNVSTLFRLGSTSIAVVDHGGLSGFLLGGLQSGRLLSPFICSSDNMDYGFSVQ